MRRVRRTIKGIAKIIHEIVIKTISGFWSVSVNDAVALDKVTVYGDSKQVPPLYTELEYIDGWWADSSTRTYIDTGITPTANKLRIEYKWKLLGNAYWGSFMWAVTGTVPRAWFRYFSNANSWQLCLQTYSYTYNIDMWYDIFDTDITINNQTKKMTGYVNSTTLNETNSGIDLNFNKNMLIHGIYLGDNVSTWTPNRCYHCRITKNDVLVRDFVPVIRNSDNEIWYYDKVSETFFPNLWPWTFTAWPKKKLYDIVSNNWALKVRESIADFSSGLIKRSTNTQVSLSSTVAGIDYTFRSSAGYIGKVFPVTVGNKYTINFGSKSSSTGSSTSIFYIELNNVITKIDDNYGSAIACPYTFTATKPYVWIRLWYPNVVSGNVTISVSGLTLIEWEIPANTIYTDGTVETVEDDLWNTATAEMLVKVWDKADSQEIISGDLNRNVRILVFDGSETFASSKTWNTFRYTFDITDYPQEVDGVSQRWSVLSTHYVSIHTSSTQTPWWSFTYNGWASNKKLYLIPADQTLNTVALFKQWLADQYKSWSPVIVMYPLNTAITESVDPQVLSFKSRDNEIEITQASIDPSELELEVEYQAIQITNS